MKKFFKNYLYIFFLCIGAVLCIDTIVLLLKTSSRTIGIFMPICLGIPLVIAGLCEYSKPGFLKNKFGKALRILYVFAYSAFCLLFAVTFTLTFSAGHAEPPKNADVLVVLGCGVRGSRPTLTLTNRLDRAIEYLEDNPDTKVIVSGGQGKGEDVSEASAMYDYLSDKGIDGGRIYVEDKSTNTQENFAYSKQIIDTLYPNGAKVCYVTTYFHVYRAGRVAKKQGIDASGIGAPGVWYITFNDYLRECVGITVYTLKGRL